MITVFIFCLFLGALAGFLAGLFGIGGGLIIVPILIWLFEYQGIPDALIMIMAIATSLATIVVTALASINAHYKLGTINWQTVYHLAPGILVGVIAGAFIADSLPSQMLRTIFTAYLLYTATKMALQLKTKASQLHLSRSLLTISGVVIGLLSTLLGIGGGTLTVPLLVSANVAMRNAVGIASACGFPIALVATVSYGLLGMQTTSVPSWSLGYIYLPAFFGIVSTSVVMAPYGARIANHLSTDKLKRYFSVMLLFAALKLML
mgnify:CR=1 FL=1